MEECYFKLLFHGSLSRFLNFMNDKKSHKALHIVCNAKIDLSYLPAGFFSNAPSRH